MRILQVHTFYDDYLNQFFANRRELASQPFAVQMTALEEDGFGAIHMLPPALTELGHEARLVIGNCFPVQKKWCKEHHPEFKLDRDWKHGVVRAQIEAFDPDILYLSDPITYDTTFVRTLARRPQLVVGWRAAPIAENVNWSDFDLMLSNNDACLAEALRRGARQAAYHRPGVPAFLSNRHRTTPKSVDVIFLGQVGPLHTKRLQDLTILAKMSEKVRPFRLAYHLFLGAGTILPPAVDRLNRGALWGGDYYNAMASARIVLNSTIDFSSRGAGNMRLFEATGIGTCLLTEHHENMADYFEPNAEVATYRDIREMLHLIYYYLDHKEERTALATRGLKRCMRDHSMAASARRFLDLIASIS